MDEAGTWIGIAGVAVAFLSLLFNRLDRRRTATKEAEAAAKAALNGMEARIMVAMVAKIDEHKRELGERVQRDREDAKEWRDEISEAVKELNRKVDSLLASLAGVRSYDRRG